MALYNQALTPEMRRITDKARGRWGKDYDYLEVINCDNDDDLRQGADGEHEQGGELQPQVLIDLRQQQRQGFFLE